MSRPPVAHLDRLGPHNVAWCGVTFTGLNRALSAQGCDCEPCLRAAHGWHARQATEATAQLVALSLRSAVTP
jgi:hypothetical protein